jgi:hypothetical protein
VAIIGLFKRRNVDYHIISYSILTLVLLIFWPREEGLRFLIPLLPFYVSFALTGLEKGNYIDHGLWRVLGKVTCVCPVIAILILFFRYSMIQSYENLANLRIENTGPYGSTSKELFSFISKNTEIDSIIVFRKPRIMRLFTDRQSILIDQVNKLSRGDYLCISPFFDDHQIENKDVVSVLESGRIDLVYGNRDFQLYKIKKWRSSSVSDLPGKL